MFTKFVEDDAAWEMFIIGAAGTGKTTQLKDKVQYCIDNKIPYVVCAYTHKACGIISSKLPDGAKVKTLHSFLNKRPTVNTAALKKEHISQSTKVGANSDEPRILFIDEWSMIGEKDYLDVLSEQDPEYEGEPSLKVVWIGDSHQLPPVKDQAVIKPKGKYVQHLTKQYRNDNPLQGPLQKLISYMDGEATPEALAPVPGFFERDKDLISEYKQAKTDDDKILLAYTNKRVEFLNRSIQGRSEPQKDDYLFSPSTQHHYTYVDAVQNPEFIDLHYTDPLQLGSKYKTLEYLIKSDNCDFVEVIGDDGDLKQFAIIFGHYQYKVMREALEKEAAASNRAIEQKFKGYKAAPWAKSNPRHKLARARAKAWRDFLSFNDCVICLDFNHAMTVHKSQGSTYETVYLDTEDLSIAAERSFEMYLKLTYVAISRASKKVITN